MKESAAEFLADYIKQTNTHNFDRVAPLIDEYAVFWFTSGSFCGLDAIRGAFEKTWAMIQDEVYAIEDVEWLTETDAAAACLYTYRWQGMIGGVACEGSGRGTTVLVNDGVRWLIIHEHLSARP
jgi:ketosteroid isomerase-like protein